MIEDAAIAAAPAPSAAAAPAPSIAAAPASSSLAAAVALAEDVQAKKKLKLSPARGVKRAPSSEDLRPLAKVPKSPPHAAAAVVEPASPANSHLFLDAWQELEQNVSFDFYSADADDEDDAKPAEEKDEEEDAKPPAI